MTPEKRHEHAQQLRQLADELDGQAMQPGQPKEDKVLEFENGEIVYYINEIGGIENIYCNYAYHESSAQLSTFVEQLLNVGNAFHTKKDAEYHKLRLESMAKRWKPTWMDTYFYLNFYTNRVECTSFDGHYDVSNYLTSNCHPTEEAAQQWADTYAKAWEVLLEGK
jgi:hypothetical protein